VCPISHKLKDYNMMKSFMISGSPTWGMGLDEDSGRSDVVPFPEENAIMMVYDGSPPPPPGRSCVSKLSPRTPDSLRLAVWGHRGVKA
jgi:hypothetical protein